MLIQFLIGTGMILVTTVIAGIGFYAVEQLLIRQPAWHARPPATHERVAMLAANVIWFLCAIFLAVLLWAALYRLLGIFDTVEESIYFSIVSYTTLGFGDILLPQKWRLLGGLESLNGLLMIGLQTAMLIEVMGRVRRLARKGDP